VAFVVSMICIEAAIIQNIIEEAPFCRG
jgi:hypothetical protein